MENPVLTDEYHRAHNVDILAGPINLSTCLDLSEQSGNVTLTSPKLLKARGRTLLVHIKALLDPTKDNANARKEEKYGKYLLIFQFSMFRKHVLHQPDRD